MENSFTFTFSLIWVSSTSSIGQAAMKVTNSVLLILIYCVFVASSSPPYTPLENIALDCGGGGATNPDGRKWITDSGSKFISSQPQMAAAAAADASTHQDSSVPVLVPYMSARFFTSQFSYLFPLSPGPKFIRLHFHPTSYSSVHFNIASSSHDAFFSVTANHYTLLRDFSPSLTAASLGRPFFNKEYCISVADSSELPVLNLTFIPALLPGAFAFVNGIEVVSMPMDLNYLKPAPDQDIPIVGQSQPLTINQYPTAAEMVYRLNVDGQSISAADDTGLFREWTQDAPFLFGPASTGQDPYHLTINIKFSKLPPYAAPEILYRTARSMGTNRTINLNYNLTWIFPVDSGFYYLVRLYFCEIAQEITGINQRVFQIFLNNQTADDQMDIMVYAGGVGVPIYREFVVTVPPAEAGEHRQDLWLALHPNSKARSKYSDALLNGLEIFKLNASDGNLAGPNPDPKPKSQVSSDQTEPSSIQAGRRNMARKPILVVGVVVVVAVALILFFIILWHLRAKKKRAADTSPGTGTGTSWWAPPFSQSVTELTKTRCAPLSSELMCRHFSLEEMRSATNNFSSDSLIGVGGFGNVYRGAINGGKTAVAVKRLNPTSRQGTREFCTEIDMLSRLRHLHLVSLIGYCAEQGEMILVYDFMGNGALRDHLYGTGKPALPWEKRLEICIGAAKGLHHLHTGAKQMIIHRDVKTANILLDDNWVAKVADFGLSKLGPSAGGTKSHVSTVVKGSLGYIDPEYYRLQRLTEKSDVYSLGVVLLEVLCGRPPVQKQKQKQVEVEEREVSLVEWGREHQKSGRLKEIVDERVRDEIEAECLSKFGEIATRCVEDEGTERPTMGDVMWGLEFAMQLQLQSQKKKLTDHQTEEGIKLTETSTDHHQGRRCNIDGGERVDDQPTLGGSGEVFSEIGNPQGR